MMKKTTTAIFVAGLLVTPAMATDTLRTQTPSPGIGGLSAEEPSSQMITQHCTGVTACNALISICAENGGTWSESSHNGIGQPTRGACVT